MPTNVTPQYRSAEERFRQAKTSQEKIIALQEMLAVMPKHKGTDHLKAQLRSRMSKLMADLEGAALHLKNHAHANGKVGIIGFCSGGRYTLMFACTSGNVDAAVDSAGGHIIPDELTESRPVATIDMVANLACPLLALFGEEDGNPSPAHATRLVEELDKHGKTYEYKMYANAGHAFFADYRPSYRAAPAQDMWRRVLLFYEKYLTS